METKEKILVALIFAGIFFPVRLLFYTYVSQYWLGSFGVMTIMMVSIIYLSRKNKLGYIGRLINKHVMSFAKGKYGIVVIFFTGIFIYFFAIVVLGIENPVGNEAVRLTLEGQGITNLETLNPRMAQVQIDPLTFVIAFLVLFTPNQISSGIFSVMNDFSNGWFLHFATVFLIEEIEIMGLILYFRFHGTKAP